MHALAADTANADRYGQGVEPQTIKLFKVCRMQGIPIFTFINKLDRQGQEPLDLLDEIEKVLGIGSYPFNWPAGAGTGSYGIYDRRSRQFELHAGGGKSKVIDCGSQGVNHPHIKAALDARSYAKLGEEIELLDTAGEPYAPEKVARGLQTPVFFGSAINGFGVDSFFNTFLQLAPPPAPRKSSAGLIEPASDDFSGFVFKIQANMNPAHRDRIAFLRICSGTFKREMLVNHARTGKKIRLSQPQQFLAQNRNIVEEAYPGDIIGLYDPGIFKVGDTISTGKTFHFARMPRFSPEHFARVSTRDALKYKQFHKGLTELAEEGAVQVFTAAGSGQIILGAVGELQFEVFQYRMKMNTAWS